MRLVKYSAEWCAPCKRFKPIVEKVAAEMNLPVEEIDIEEQPVEGITSVPTLRLLDDEDKVLASTTGAMPAPALKQWIEENTPK